MSRATDSLRLKWRAEADEHQAQAATHRVMAATDLGKGRHALWVANIKQASYLQGKADALVACARQLAQLEATHA